MNIIQKLVKVVGAVSFSLIMGCSANFGPLNSALDSGDFQAAIAALKQLTVEDVQAALQDVHDNGDVDLAALQCYPELIAFLQSTPPDQRELAVKGLVEPNQRKRDVLIGGQGGRLQIPLSIRKLHVACAAYVNDERRFAVELAAIIGAASHGVPPVMPIQ